MRGNKEGERKIEKRGIVGAQTTGLKGAWRHCQFTVPIQRFLMLSGPARSISYGGLTGSGAIASLDLAISFEVFCKNCIVGSI